MGAPKADALWTPIINKANNQPYKNLEKCADLKRFETEEPTLANLLSAKLQEFLKSGEAAEKQLKTTGKDGGLRIKEGEYEYKLSKWNEQLQLTRSKAGMWTSGGRKSTFTFMRTVEVRKARIEAVQQILSSQGPEDNWRITELTSDNQGHNFLMENLRQYTPGSAAAPSEEKKENDSEAEEEDNAGN